MSYELSAKELRNTIALESPGRLDYFVSKVIATGELWTLAQDESLLVLGTETISQFVPVWPHSDFALNWFEDCGIEEADLVAMKLNDWLESTFEELFEAEIHINVFPTDEDDGMILRASDMAKLFLDVLSKES